MSAVESLWQWALAGFAGVVGTVAGVVWRNRTRSIKNKDRLEGDPDNPNDDGLMDIVADNNRRLRELEQQMHDEHEEVVEELRRLGDE